MTKFTQQKTKTKNNFYLKLKTLKEEYRMKENMYSDSMCRLIKDLARQLSRTPDTLQGLLQMKKKTVEMSFIATEQLFKKIAEHCYKTSEAETILAEINKMSDRKTKKKSDIIAVVNYVRRLQKGIQISKQMNNLNFLKDY